MIKVLFFARLQDETGKESIEVDKTNITVDDLKQHLEEEYNLSSLSHTMVAVNENYADGSTTLKEGDTLALIPPVSGG
ncbi:molybdopterin converting factor subunit 1 [Bacillus piscicola]|uniref:molybdopterin converting factor subunit 1 n=1 Tax=Bacillus piscicola TaxID=1632684 RepID=UPI001F08A44D|nr:molybdopterin converting factor subunit 1 [Bacillus piscicola]